MTLDSATVPDLQDRDPKVREAVLEQLGGSGDPLPVDSLAEMVQTDTNPVLRMDALELLAEKGGEAALDPLKQALRDPDPAVRGLAQGLIEERRVLAQTVLEQLKVEDP
jgi:HEAT repeat protein